MVNPEFAVPNHRDCGANPLAINSRRFSRKDDRVRINLTIVWLGSAFGIIYYLLNLA